MWVCQSRSGDSPRGYYANFDRVDHICEELHERGASMGLSASFNAAGFRSLEEVADVCGPVSPALSANLELANLAIGGADTRFCDVGNGRLGLTAYALGGPDDGNGPTYLYFASLLTTQETVEADSPAFAKFLAEARIGSSTRSEQR